MDNGNGGRVAGAGDEWIDRFTRSARDERHVSASTLEAYGLDLAILSRWAAGRGKHLDALSTADLTGYVVERAAEGIQLSTLARHMSSFRRFYAFLVHHGAVALNPAAAVLVPQGLRPGSGLVRAEVVRSLLRAPRGDFVSPASAYRARRDHAIVCMLYGTGLGISDVRLLRWQQIDEHWHVVRVPLRDGAIRSFVLDETLMGILKTLHESAATNGFSPAQGAYCFPTASGLPMTRQALCHVVRKWASECGQEQGVTPSALRQTGRAHQFGRRPSRSAPAVA
ncbi:MAG: site-specific integrase [Gammaproteobacteria bacterium]